MLVVIANDLPPAVRGRMKLWFVEARANVFVSGIRDAVATSVIDYLFAHCPARSGLLIFQKISSAPGYRIHGMGDTRRLKEFSGLQLALENDELPFAPSRNLS